MCVSARAHLSVCLQLAFKTGLFPIYFPAGASAPARNTDSARGQTLYFIFDEGNLHHAYSATTAAGNNSTATSATAAAAAAACCHRAQLK